MSEPFTETEKQRIYVELIAEIAENEQDLEQCNAETGRYSRDFLYNIRDLEQLYSFTECPLSSRQLKKFDIFAKNKNVVGKWWKRMKSWIMKRQGVGKACIEKKDNERMEVKEKKEERCLNEQEVFPFLALPKELQYKVYPHFDLEARRALRIIEELGKIEMNTKYRYKSLTVRIKEDRVILRAHNNGPMVIRCYVPHSEVEKELEIMAKNTQFDDLCFSSHLSDSLQITNALQSVKLSRTCITNTPSFNDSELQSIVQNIEEIFILHQSAITENGLFWIYEKMRDRQLDLKKAHFKISETIRSNFLDKFGTFDRETLEFVGTNPNQTFLHCTGFECIYEGALKMHVNLRDKDGKIGAVTIYQE